MQHSNNYVFGFKPVDVKKAKVQRAEHLSRFFVEYNVFLRCDWPVDRGATARMLQARGCGDRDLGLHYGNTRPNREGYYISFDFQIEFDNKYLFLGTDFFMSPFTLDKHFILFFVYAKELMLHTYY